MSKVALNSCQGFSTFYDFGRSGVIVRETAVTSKALRFPDKFLWWYLIWSEACLLHYGAYATDKTPPTPSVSVQAFHLRPGVALWLDSAFCIPSPAITRSPSPSVTLRVPPEVLSGNAVSWSAKGMAYPWPFPVHDLLFNRCLPCDLPQVKVTQW